VVRYGGEEFLVVLPDCDETQTLQNAERIRSVIAERALSAAGSDIVVTISIGATVLSTCTVSAMQILATADTALYEAKTKGRNQTVLRIPRMLAAVSRPYTDGKSPIAGRPWAIRRLNLIHSPRPGSREIAGALVDRVPLPLRKRPRMPGSTRPDPWFAAIQRVDRSIRFPCRSWGPCCVSTAG
jgi:hypothetical protein